MSEPERFTYDAQKSIDEKRLINLRYEIPEYLADNPLPPVPPSLWDAQKHRFPDISLYSPKRVFQMRHGLLQERCNKWNLKLESSNVRQLPAPNSYVAKGKDGVPDVYKLKNVKSLVRDRGDSNSSRRRALVFQDTNRKLQKVREKYSSDDQEFCYWQFQNSLKLSGILEESCWLKNKIGGEDFPFKKSSDKLEFETIYGHINRKEEGMACLVEKFRRKTIYASELNRKLDMLLAFSHKLGKVAALKAIEDMEAFALESLKLPADQPGYMLLEMGKDPNSIFNVNPLKNVSQTDWFHFKRFEKDVGPSNLFIRHMKLENLGLVDYKIPKGTVLVTGLSASFIDTIFTYPFQKPKDPCRKLFQKRDKLERDARGIRWKTLCEYIREEINLYTCGIEIDLFFGRLKGLRQIADWPFENMSAKEVVKKLPEFFIVKELPGTGAKIVFPTFMKFIVPMGEEDGQLGLMMILEKFWRRAVFLVRMMGGCMRNMDFKWEYWNFYKKGIVVQEWGFKEMGDYVEWCNQMWNLDGMGECIVMESHSGSPDPFLVYKPRRELRGGEEEQLNG